jgi:hypothetical protein
MKSLDVFTKRRIHIRKLNDLNEINKFIILIGKKILNISKI